MVRAAALAFDDTVSGDGVRVLLLAAGTALVLLAGAFAGVWWLAGLIMWFEQGWLNSLLGWTAVLGAGLAVWFALIPLVITLVAVYAEAMLDRIERRRYPGLPPARQVRATESLRLALGSVGRAAVLNLVLLPLWLVPGVNLLVALANGWLIGRDLYDVTAQRRMPLAEARAFRDRARLSTLPMGVAVALLFGIPVLNLFAALFGLLWMLHAVTAAWAAAADAGG